MSRVGYLPIEIPEGVKFEFKNNILEVTGPLGKLSRKIPSSIKLTSNKTIITLEREDDKKNNRAIHGLTRSLVNNMFIGVTKGFSKKLVINGLGYRAELKDTNLILSLGFSHPVIFPIPENIKIAVAKTELTVSGVDKQFVGEIAAEIRRIRKPEPYKGKGIRYIDEVIKRKAGKSAVSSGFGSGGGS